MNRRFLGGGLVGIGLLMLVGFFNSDLPITAGSTLAALLLTVALPVGGGIAVLVGERRRLGARGRNRELLRQQTLEAEVLRLARLRGGRLTALEVATEFALSPEEAKGLLDSLMTREHADIEVTDSGLLVYRFGDVQRLEDKHGSRGLLED